MGDQKLTHGEILRRTREKKRLTQEQLCELTGIRQPNLSAMENDRRPYSLANVVVIADVLECSVDHLLGRIS